MIHQITWTISASGDYFKIIDYLFAEWGQKSAIKFEIKLMKQIDLISKMPNLCPATQLRKKVRRCIIVKQVSLFYIVSDTEIIILRLVDNRQNPDKLLDMLNKENVCSEDN